MNEVLRNYQREMLDRLKVAWASHRSVMVQMPTGTGKTVLMAEIIKSLECKVYSLEIQSTRQPVLIVAHRRELIEQIKDTLDRRTGFFRQKNRRTKSSYCNEYPETGTGESKRFITQYQLFAYHHR